MPKSQTRATRIKTAATKLSKEINAELKQLKARASHASGRAKPDLQLRIRKLTRIEDGVVCLLFGKKCLLKGLPESEDKD